MFNVIFWIYARGRAYERRLIENKLLRYRRGTFNPLDLHMTESPEETRERIDLDNKVEAAIHDLIYGLRSDK